MWSSPAWALSENAILGYQGEMFLDVMVHPEDPKYQIVRALLERRDGTPRNPQVILYLLPLESAVKNAHHDEPGSGSGPLEW